MQRLHGEQARYLVITPRVRPCSGCMGSRCSGLRTAARLTMVRLTRLDVLWLDLLYQTHYG
jgi:hypothetical protein